MNNFTEKTNNINLSVGVNNGVAGIVQAIALAGAVFTGILLVGVAIIACV